jgi:hypothetical protein
MGNGVIMRKFGIACSIALVMCASASAQNISVDELKQMIDERVGGLNEYQELLNDPDTRRAMAAMTIMLESDDPELQRMARQYGLFSPDPAVQQTALKAHFDREPVIELRLDGSVAEGNTFNKQMLNNNGSVRPDGTAFISFKLGKFDPNMGCYVYSERRNRCALRLSSNGVSVNLSGYGWGDLSLSDSGELAGYLPIAGVNEPIPASINLAQ